MARAANVVELLRKSGGWKDVGEAGFWAGLGLEELDQWW